MIKSFYLKLISIDDLYDLRSISIETFKQTFSAQNTKENIRLYLKNKMSVKQLKKEISNINSKFYIVYQKNKVIGYFKLNFNGSQRVKMYLNNGFEIERIYLISEFQGKGLGKKLLTKILNMGKEMGYRKAWLGVWENNFRAIKFYRKYGFKKFGQHSFLLGKDLQTDYLLVMNV